jgi:hypothetical protein
MFEGLEIYVPGSFRELYGVKNIPHDEFFPNIPTFPL